LSIGAGEGFDAASATVFVGSTPGRRVAFVAVAAGQDPASARETIRAARAQAAIVVVSVHNHETTDGSDTPADAVTALAHDAIAAGAQVVVEYGSRQIRGMERVGNGVVFYGLGLFSYDPAVTGLPSLASDGAEGLVVTTAFDGETLTEVTIHPIQLQSDSTAGSVGVPERAKGSQAETIVQRFSALSTGEGQRLPFEASDGALHLVVLKK
jgi:poly-gamma-glutamate synthesis protein (capsule biosynthesis protein)